NAVDAISSYETEDTAQEETNGTAVLGAITEVVDGVHHNAATTTVNFCGGKLIYNWLASGNLDGDTVTLSNEAEFLTAAISAGSAMGDADTDPEGTAEALRRIVPAFSKSRMIPVLAAEFLAGAGEAWGQGEPFCGMDAPEIGDELGSMDEDLWSALEESNADTVKEDVATLINVVALMIEHEVADTLEEDAMALLRDKEITELLLYELLANDRLYTVVHGLLDFGMESALSGLDVMDSLDGAYENYLRDFCAVADGGDLSVSEAAKQYKEVLNQYGIPCELTDTDWEEKAQAVADGTTTVRALAESFVSSQADFEQKTVLLTIEDVLMDFGEMTDPEAEAKHLADAFAQLLGVLDDLDQSDPDMTKLFASFGPAMDSLASTETVGYRKTSAFLTAFLQSKSVRENCYLNTVEATEVANSILAGTQDAEGRYVKGSFAAMMTSLGKTVEVIANVASSDGELTQEDIEHLLDTLTPASAEVIKSLSTPEMIEKHGVEVKSAEKVAGVIGDIFTSYAEKNESQEWSEEQKQKEAAAMTQMMNLMMTDTTENRNALFGNEGALGVSADEYVDTLFDSQVLTEAVLSLSYDENGQLVDDPMHLEKSMNQTETDQLMDAFNSKYSASDDQEETAKLIQGTAAMMNLTVELVDGQWVSLGYNAE
ncbi:MAG: hypothetical protein IJY42_00055, partial [Clostridia bacterium]|nr:hypothetical protein [Clostridia bacterium]